MQRKKAISRTHKDHNILKINSEYCEQKKGKILFQYLNAAAEMLLFFNKPFDLFWWILYNLKH